MKKRRFLKLGIVNLFVFVAFLLPNFTETFNLFDFSYIVYAQDPATTVSPQPAIQWNHDLMNIQAAWEDGYTGEGIKIAILDTGFYHRHPDIEMAGGYSVFADDAWSNDHSGHGTHIAGIIGASRGTTYQGIAPDAEIYGIKIYHAENIDENGYVSTDVNSVVKGMRQAINMEADIIVISSGLTFHAPELHNIIVEAYNENILILAASGNGNSSVNYPAKYPEVVSVTAVDERLHPALDIIYGEENEFAAPGVNIGGLSIPDSTYSYPYIFMSGSSQATPHAAGLAAIIMQKYSVRGQQAREIMQQQAVDIGDPNLYGHGLIQYASDTTEESSEVAEEEPAQEETEATEENVQPAAESEEGTEGEEATARKPESSREADANDPDTQEITSYYQTEPFESDNGAILGLEVLPIVESGGRLDVALGNFNSLYIAENQVREIRDRNIRIILTKDEVSWTIPPANFISGDATLRFYEGVPTGTKKQTGALTPIYTTAIFQDGARQDAHPSQMEIRYNLSNLPETSSLQDEGYRWDKNEQEWVETDMVVTDEHLVLSSRHTTAFGAFNPEEIGLEDPEIEETITEPIIESEETSEGVSQITIQIVIGLVLFICLLLGVRFLLKKRKR